jgi:predicted Rossmann fold nucleotide-binding protein DprA/Smf involved in DNA uptake
MSQAIDQWQSRGIWIVSRADPAYPRRLKAKLKQQAPAILFGCGDRSLLEQGGIGIVGSRKVDDAISEFVENAAKLASNSGYSVVSGGARGVDQIAMRTALDVEGTVVGALAENLNRAVVAPHYRNALRSHSLVLISAVDPSAGFNVGNAMSRNKLIYALSDAGLVANADFEKGGTWAGAIEQIDRFKCCPVYVRTTDRTPKGNKALIERGAIAWPEPKDMESFRSLIESPPAALATSEARELDFTATKGALAEEPAIREPKKEDPFVEGPEVSPAELLQKTATQAILEILKDRPMNETDIAEALRILKTQARAWLDLLCKEGAIEKTKKPVRYQLKELQRSQAELF